MQEGCTLCGMALPSLSPQEGGRSFCCPGCHAVYQILSAKAETADFRTHPLFLAAVKAGLISNPELLDRIRTETKRLDGEETQRLHLEVGGLWCASCVEIIRLLLLNEKGVKSCAVDYATDLAAVEFCPRHIGKESIIALIESLGYQAKEFRDFAGKAVSFNLYLRFLVAAFFSLNTMMFAYPLYATYFNYDAEGAGPLFAWLSCAASLPVVAYSGWPIWRRFWNSLRVGYLGMETLVAIGVSAAFGLSLYELMQGSTRVYFDSMTVIIAFVLLGKIMEAKAKFSAKDSLLLLTKALPRRGRKVLPNGEHLFLPMKDLAAGDLIAVFTGEKIVLDGVVVDGGGCCDESLMTGEAIPVVKKVGDPILGGTLLQNGWMVYRAASNAEGTALRQIIRTVEQDIGRKNVYVRGVDTLVRYFVPAVLLIAAAAGLSTGSLQEGVLRAVSVLLISCPCAIGIAVPLAEAHLINGLAKLGVIVRNRSALEYLGRETTFIFDKTGTLTEGHFQLLQPIQGVTAEHISILKAMAGRSSHPISRALDDAIEAPAAEISHFEEHTGRGVSAVHGASRYFLGSRAFLQLHGIDVAEEPVSGVATRVYFGGDQALIGNFLLGDRLRENIDEVIHGIAPAKTLLLSGDTGAAVEAVARGCSIAAWRAECSPLQKRDFVEELRKQGEIVGMVGDGINDAPAITAAHVGISVVTAADVSVQVSDLLLTTDRLSVIVKARQLACKGRRIIGLNLFWAFFYNVAGIALAAFGVLTPLYAAAAMVVSSLFVLFNAQRLSFYQFRMILPERPERAVSKPFS